MLTNKQRDKQTEVKTVSLPKVAEIMTFENFFTTTVEVKKDTKKTKQNKNK